MAVVGMAVAASDMQSTSRLAAVDVSAMRSSCHRCMVESLLGPCWLARRISDQSHECVGDIGASSSHRKATNAHVSQSTSRTAEADGSAMHSSCLHCMVDSVICPAWAHDALTMCRSTAWRVLVPRLQPLALSSCHGAAPEGPFSKVCCWCCCLPSLPRACSGSMIESDSALRCIMRHTYRHASAQ